jgi:hypothetical protein
MEINFINNGLNNFMESWKFIEMASKYCFFEDFMYFVNFWINTNIAIKESDIAIEGKFIMHRKYWLNLDIWWKH